MFILIMWNRDLSDQIYYFDFWNHAQAHANRNMVREWGYWTILLDCDVASAMPPLQRPQRGRR